MYEANLQATDTASENGSEGQAPGDGRSSSSWRNGMRGAANTGPERTVCVFGSPFARPPRSAEPYANPHRRGRDRRTSRWQC
jgi:hypothetical protein